MSYVIVRTFPKQNASQIIKAYKSRSGAQAFLEKNPQYNLRKYNLRKVKVLAA